MNDTKKFRQENEQWHRDHELWAEEVKLWQHESERLVAMLYRIERAIPDHSSLLEQHKSLIEEHEQRVISYECGIDEHCIKTCPDYKTPEQQRHFHKDLSEVHEKTRRQHDKIKQLYSTEMKKFRALLLELLEESESWFND